jgi:predicted transposase YbfD/YdcC
LGRIFSILDPEAFERCFFAWVKTVRIRKKGEIVAIDGKSSRRSHSVGKKPLHLVNAFSAENGIALGQRKVDGKSNEITAIPELLEMLSLRDCIVTADAMGTQAWIVKKILENKADYVLAVKGNQGKLFRDLKKIFHEPNAKVLKNSTRTSERSHGSEEIRECFVSDDLSGITEIDRWEKLRSVAKITATRKVDGKISTESRYFISSLPADSKEILRAVRTQWKVENSLHWSLDISFREDESHVRVGYAGENLVLVRKLALNLLCREKTAKGDIRAKRLRAGWNRDYLLTVLGVGQ